MAKAYSKQYAFASAPSQRTTPASARPLPGSTLGCMGPVSTSESSVTAAFPNLRQTAEIINVTTASLVRATSRLTSRLAYVAGELRFPPAVVLELARLYRSRDMSEVAAELVDLALTQAPEFASEIEGQVDVALDREVETTTAVSLQQFLKEAKHHLPPKLYAEAVAALSGDHPPANGGSTTNLTEVQ